MDRNAVGVFGGGALTNEKVYLLGKLARVALGTSNIDYNGRFCMSSGAAAATMALGLDRGLPFPLDDIPHATAILLAGANIAETMPPLMQYFEAQQLRGGAVVVADPRRTPTAAWAGRHLAIRPGTDAALANGSLHVLIRDELIDQAYIRERTEGFDEVRRLAAIYWPQRVEEITGRPGSRDCRNGAVARTCGAPDDPHLARARAAVAGCEQHAGVHQHRSRPRCCRSPVQRLRMCDGPEQRSGRTRARAEGGSTARLPAHRR